MSQRKTWIAAVAAVALVGGAGRSLVRADFVTFETGQVRPLALSPDGSRLFAINTPDNQLEIFDVGPGGLTHAGSVAVGLEPVAVAARTNSEVWVVNHLSDSISIVDAGSVPPRVTRTLLVGDEPRDIVFAGSSGNRAFITTAHRGQNSPVDPQFTTEGVGRADVWVFDATDLGTSLGGDPETILTLFGDTPRALAASADGSTVYAAVFQSGNQTTTLPEGAVCDTGEYALASDVVEGLCYVVGFFPMPGGLPLPHRSADGVTRPETGLIVKYNPTLSRWEDELGRNWNDAVKFTLPDEDVFAIDADGNPPTQTASFPGVGTVLFNMVVNPSTGNVYVTNTDAINEVRFEGPGIRGGSTVRGHLHEARVTVLDIQGGGTVKPRHLNKHIDYDVVPSPAGVKDASLATPVGVAVNAAGTKLYVAAFGSSQIGVYDTSSLEDNSFNPTSVPHAGVSGGGPSGLALDETNGRLYVLTRFNNAVAAIDTTTLTEVSSVPLHNPEPPSVVRGRPFLYDASFTSSNGEASCSSCHIFGDFDSLGWDLGNPDGKVLDNLNPNRVSQIPPIAPGVVIAFPDHHPMKGPMTTQSLRGMANHGPMHWRGDRSGANDVNGSELDEDAAFKRFNVAFGGLLGRTGPLKKQEMQEFTDFILQVTYPPNPVRALDNSLTPDQQAGHDFFFGPDPVDIFQPCDGCHVLDVGAQFFGSDGVSTFENETQFFKVAHLRNLYQKVGMFGMTYVPFFNFGDHDPKGDQVRGFGFLHDGSVDTVFRFVNAVAFNEFTIGPLSNPGGFPAGAPGVLLRQQMEQFLLAFDTNLAPVVGQQITLDSSNAGTVGPRIDLMIDRAAAGECDLTVKGAVSSEQRGWYRTAAGTFQSDRAADAVVSDAQLRSLSATAGQEATYTCVPTGSGRRIGVDRDDDSTFDHDELDEGLDPADPFSVEFKCPDGADEAIQVSKLTVRRNPLPAGDEKLVITGEFVIATPVSPSIDLVGNGFLFAVMDPNNVPIFQRAVPSGAAAPGGSGWTSNQKKTTFRFKDLTLALADGVRKVVVRDRSNITPGLFSFRIKAEGDFRIDANQLPVRLVVVLGNGHQITTGQCGTRTLNVSGGPAPSCQTSANGDVLRCT